jgi:chitodextrinase
MMSIGDRASSLSLVLALVTGSSTAWAARDRIAPTAPTNFRVTGMTSYTVSLAWSPSTDNSGVFSYVICCANTSSESVGQQATSHTYRAGLEASRTFTLRIYARDAAGNTSKASNAVTFTLPADTTPPTKPLVSVTDVGPTHVSLAWSSVEDGPHVWFTVFKDGSPVIQGSESTSAIIPLLKTETSYTFSVQAQDFAGNRSPLSEASAVTTEASNPDDVTPPTTPGNFNASSWGCEVELGWSESTDDLDPQWIIEYQVFVNDVYDHSLSLRSTRTVAYGTADGANTFSVVAVDSAGNRSVPATVTADLDCVP